MSENHIIDTALSQVEEKSLEEKFQNDTEHYFYAIDSRVVQCLGIEEAYLYSIICALSLTKGYCWMQTKTFCLRLGKSESSVKRLLVSLKEGGYIYSNSFQTRTGRRRHLIPQSEWINYSSNYLSRSCVPDEVKKQFTDITGVVVMDRSVFKKRLPRVKNDPSKARVKNDPSILLRNNSKERATRDAAASSSFLDSLKDAGASEKQIIQINSYIERNPKWLEGKERPTGYIIQGLKDGWLMPRVLEDTKKNQTEIEAQQQLNSNRKRAQDLFTKCKGTVWEKRVKVNECYVQVYTDGKPLLNPLSFKEASFDEKFIKMETIIKDHIDIIKPKEDS